MTTQVRPGLPGRWSACAFAAALTLVAGLAPPAQAASQTSQLLGTLLGGIAGAAAGSQFGSGDGNTAATAIGGVLGAVLGNQLVASLESSNEPAYRGYGPYSGYAGPPQAYAPPAYQPSYAGYPTAAYQPSYASLQPVAGYPAYQQPAVRAGSDCRAFFTTINIDGVAQNARGTACRQPDGSWKIVD